MCEQCLVNPYYFGEVIPGWWLIRARRDGDIMRTKDWGLVECNSPSFVFTTTPFTYPDQNCYWDAKSSFQEEFYCTPEVGHRFVEAFNKVCNNDMFHFTSRVYDYIAEYIAKTTPWVDNDPIPDRDNYVEYNYTYDAKELVINN